MLPNCARDAALVVEYASMFEKFVNSHTVRQIKEAWRKSAEEMADYVDLIKKLRIVGMCR